MRSGRSGLVTFGVILAVGLAPACVLDPGQKHACASATDCLAGRVCVAGTCRSVDLVDAGSAGGGGASAGGGGGSSVGGQGGGAVAGGTGSTDAAADAAMGVDLGGVDTPAVDASSTGDAQDAHAASDGPDVPETDAGSDGAMEARPRYVASGTPNYMFVTSQRHVPNFGSLAAADKICNDAAKAAPLPGTFRAWLSTTAVAARDRIKDARGWIRPDGAPFADRMVDVAAGRILYPPLIYELGHELRGYQVATGTDEQGGLGTDNCRDWTPTSSGDSTKTGDTQAGPSRWTAGPGTVTVACTEPMPIYCFGIDHVTPLSVVPVAGKKAFVSDGLFTTTGLDGADKVCAAEATKAGLPGTFAALIATTTQTPASRFAGGLHQWVRLDGVPLDGPGQDLFLDGPKMAPLCVTSAGAYLSGEALTGAYTASSVSQDSPSSCFDWTDFGADPSGIVGDSGSVTFWFSHGAEYDACNRIHAHVYCLEK